MLLSAVCSVAVLADFAFLWSSLSVSLPLSSSLLLSLLSSLDDEDAVRLFVGFGFVTLVVDLLDLSTTFDVLVTADDLGVSLVFGFRGGGGFFLVFGLSDLF